MSSNAQAPGRCDIRACPPPNDSLHKQSPRGQNMMRAHRCCRAAQDRKPGSHQEHGALHFTAWAVRGQQGMRLPPKDETRITCANGVAQDVRESEGVGKLARAESGTKNGWSLKKGALVMLLAIPEVAPPTWCVYKVAGTKSFRKCRPRGLPFSRWPPFPHRFRSLQLESKCVALSPTKALSAPLSQANKHRRKVHSCRRSQSFHRSTHRLMVMWGEEGPYFFSIQPGMWSTNPGLPRAAHLQCPVLPHMLDTQAARMFCNLRPSHIEDGGRWHPKNVVMGSQAGQPSCSAGQHRRSRGVMSNSHDPPRCNMKLSG